MTSAEASVKACESLQHAERRFGQRDRTQLSAPLSIWSCLRKRSVVRYEYGATAKDSELAATTSAAL